MHSTQSQIQIEIKKTTRKPKEEFCASLNKNDGVRGKCITPNPKINNNNNDH